MKQSNLIEFESMSVDELWNLHEKLRAILSMKLDAGKHELERRLAQLNGRIEHKQDAPTLPEGASKISESGAAL